jgi:hypothetical protein
MQTATNKETGERFYLEGDKWLPMKTAVNQETGEEFGLMSGEWVSIAPQKFSPPPSPPPAEGDPEGIFGGNNYYIDKLKSGAADFVMSILPEDVTDKLLGIDVFEYAKQDGTFDTRKLQVDRAAAIQDAKEQFFGYDGIKPESEVQRFAGEALESVAAEGPMAIVGAKGFTGGLVELLHSYSASLLGRFGAETGEKVAELLGGEGAAQGIAGSIGGIIGGGSTIAGRAASGAALQAASGAIKERKRVNESLDTATEFVASKEVGNVIKKATEADPDLDSVIKATSEIEDAVPGLVIPPITVLADNPIYRKNIDYLLRTNPEFYAKAKEGLNNAVKSINDRKERLFGTSGPEADARIRKNLPKDYTATLSGARKRQNAIDQQLEKISEKVRSSVEFADVGAQVDALMKAKEAAVTQRLSPQYANLLKSAEESGTVFPAASVAEIHRAYKALENRDVFATFPALTKKLKTEWSPKKVEPSPIIIPGQPEPKATLQYKPVSMTEMDSFKRELNKSIRKTKDSTQLRILNGLKDSLKAEVAKLPDEFGQKYNSLDLQFYKELGVPRSKAEISQLDSARFNSQAGQYLSRPEQAKEFIAFVGPAGIPVVKNAIFLRMQGSGLKSGGVFDKNGILDPKALAGFINKNKALIDTVPGLRNELLDARTLVDNLTQTKSRIDSEYNIRAKELTEGFYSAFEKKGLKEVSSQILKSNAESAKILKNIKNFDPETSRIVRQGIRASLLERAVESGDTMLDFIKKNEKAFMDWFGPTYLKSVESIGAASDRVSKVDIDKMKFALDYKDRDQMLEKVGISFPQFQSVLRDRISNGMTKLAIIGSKVSTSSAAAKRDSKMMDLLLNPGALDAIRKQVEASKMKVIDEKFMANIAQLIHNSVFKGLYFGTEAAESVREERSLEEAVAAQQPNPS